MKTNSNTLIRVINRFLYFSSAALLLTALVLGTVFTPAQASVNLTATPIPDYKLNLSHIACVNNQVEVHFVLLNVPDGVTPGSDVTFTLKINGGSPITVTAARDKNTGNVWHYLFYGSSNGYYDVTSAYVYVGSTIVYLHNPDSYSDQNNNCSTGSTPVPSATFTATATGTSLPTNTPTATGTSLPTNTPTATGTSLPTNTPTATGTSLPTNTPTATGTSLPTNTPTATGTSLPTNTPTMTATGTLVPSDTPTDTATPVPTTETPVPTTETPIPTQETLIPTVTTSVPTEPPHVLEPLSLVTDPFCSVDNRVQWTVENPNSVSFVFTAYSIDGGPKQPGFSAPSGSIELTTTALGTHTVTLYYGESQTISYTYTLNVCPLTIPVTGVGGLIIPVTGADQSGNLSQGALFSGLSLGGLGLLLSALRKLLKF